MKNILYLLFILTACSDNVKENSNPGGTKKESSNRLVGKWVYERIEELNGVPIDTRDSAFSMLHRQHIGLTFSFTDDYVFKVTQMKGNTEEFVAEQKYELPEGEKTLRLINTGRPHDEFPIIGISDSLLRINVFKSKIGYLVFKKK